MEHKLKFGVLFICIVVLGVVAVSALALGDLGSDGASSRFRSCGSNDVATTRCFTTDDVVCGSPHNGEAYSCNAECANSVNGYMWTFRERCDNQGCNNHGGQSRCYEVVEDTGFEGMCRLI